MDDSRNSGTMSDTSSSPPSSSQRPSRSFAGHMADAAALIGAGAASWFIQRMEAQPGQLIPWQYRFWALVGIWACLLLRKDLQTRIVDATIGRFIGRGNSDPPR